MSFFFVPCTVPSFYTSLVDLEASLLTVPSVPYLTLNTPGHVLNPSFPRRCRSRFGSGPRDWLAFRVLLSLLKRKLGLVRFLFSSPSAFPASLSLIHLQVLHAFRSVFVVSILVFIHTHSCCLRREFVSPACCAEGLVLRPAANRLCFEALSHHVICFDAIKRGSEEKLVGRQAGR